MEFPSHLFNVIDKMDLPPLPAAAAPFPCTVSQAFLPLQLSIARCLSPLMVPLMGEGEGGGKGEGEGEDSGKGTVVARAAARAVAVVVVAMMAAIAMAGVAAALVGSGGSGGCGR